MYKTDGGKRKITTVVRCLTGKRLPVIWQCYRFRQNYVWRTTGNLREDDTCSARFRLKIAEFLRIFPTDAENRALKSGRKGMMRRVSFFANAGLSTTTTRYTVVMVPTKRRHRLGLVSRRINTCVPRTRVVSAVRGRRNTRLRSLPHPPTTSTSESLRISITRGAASCECARHDGTIINIVVARRVCVCTAPLTTV